MSVSGASPSGPTLRGLLAGGLIGAMVVWSQIGLAESDGPLRGSQANGEGPAMSSPPTAIASKFAAVAATRLQSTARLSARRSSAPVTAIVSTSAAMLLLKAVMSGAIGRRQRAKWKATSQARSPMGGSKAMSSGRLLRRRSLRSTGRRQTVSIRPKGGDIASVDVVLARAES